MVVGSLRPQTLTRALTRSVSFLELWRFVADQSVSAAAIDAVSKTAGEVVSVLFDIHNSRSEIEAYLTGPVVLGDPIYCDPIVNINRAVREPHVVGWRAAVTFEIKLNAGRRDLAD